MVIYQSLADALKSLRRHILMTTASVLVIFLAVFTASAFAGLSWSLGGILDYLETRAQMTIFFQDDANEEEIARFQSILTQSPEIASVNYVSKDEALRLYTSQHENEPVLLESVTSNIFPASLDIRARDIASLTNLADYLGGSAVASSGGATVLGLQTYLLAELDAYKPLIEEIVFYKDAAKTLSYWLRAVRVSGLVLTSFLGVVSLLIVLVLVGLTIRSSREEIGVMKLVGATDWYVQFPYLLQGLLAGLFGALLSVITFSVLLPVGKYFGGDLLAALPLPSVSWHILVVFALLQLTVGGAVGVVGSFVAVRRYLKV